MIFREKCKQRTERITDFIVDVNLSYLILMKLRDYQANKNDILNISPAFYGTVIRNTTQSIIVELSKLFYKNDIDNTESVFSLLKKMQKNLKLLKKRDISTMQMKTISFVDAYCMDFNSTSEMIEYYLKEIKKKDKKITSLTKLRNKYYAHWDQTSLNDLDALFKKYSVSLLDIQELLVLASNICMALYQYFKDTTFYPIVENYEDISKTIHCIEEYKRLSEKYEDYGL